TSATALPTLTCVPATGVWLITDPAGTVVLVAVVIAPTVRFAPVIAEEAAACVRPVTLGTATCGRPEETTSATALPTLTCVPATGVWLITDPAGTVVLVAVVIAPTVRFAPVIAEDAAACVRPVTLGTATCGGPDDTTSVTTLPALTRVPATGDWLITEPAGTVVLGAVELPSPSDRPAPASALVAAASVSPTTLGTVTCGIPVDTTRATALPTFTCVPATGVWLITDPDGTVVLEAVLIVPTVRFAPVMADVAAACVRPTTFGTGAWAGPDETTSATALPVLTCVPAAGVWLITDPAATVA